MTKRELNTDLSVEEAARLITECYGANLVNQEELKCGDKKVIVITMEQYFSRVGGWVGLVVIIDDRRETTHVSIHDVASSHRYTKTDFGLIIGARMVDEVYKLVDEACYIDSDPEHPEFDTMYFTDEDEEALIHTVTDYIHNHPEIKVLDKAYDTTETDDQKKVFTCFLTFKKMN